MNISNGLFQIAGFFEKYGQTGGVVSAVEARYLAAQLGALAEATRAQAIALQAVGDEFDAFIETAGAAADRRPARAFSVIEGGK